MYNFLRAPPYNRHVFAWEDATDAVNASWVDATTGGLTLQQWNGSPGEWREGVCDIAHSSNASVLVSGPFADVITPPGKSYGAIPYKCVCEQPPRRLRRAVPSRAFFSRHLRPPRHCRHPAPIPK